eukprot:1161942-Pelagomonas_calceolata.AAC.15
MLIPKVFCGHHARGSYQKSMHRGHFKSCPNVFACQGESCGCMSYQAFETVCDMKLPLLPNQLAHALTVSRLLACFVVASSLPVGLSEYLEAGIIWLKTSVLAAVLKKAQSGFALCRAAPQYLWYLFNPLWALDREQDQPHSVVMLLDALDEACDGAYGWERVAAMISRE